MLPPLLHRVWTERNEGAPSAYGATEAWVPVLADVACTWYQASGRESADQNRTVVVIDERIILEAETDIRPGDRIVKVVDEYGRTVVDTSQHRQVEVVLFQGDRHECSIRSTGG